jgi:hypothetical protein
MITELIQQLTPLLDDVREKLKSPPTKRHVDSYKEMLATLDVLEFYWKDGIRVTQKELAQSLPDFGHLEPFEIMSDTENQTSIRKARAIVQHLRQLCVPIVASSDHRNPGYWLPSTPEELQDWCDRRATEIESTYRSSKDTLQKAASKCSIEVVFPGPEES